jgi:hypothetical protein
MNEEYSQISRINKDGYDVDHKVMSDVISKHENVRERAVKYTYQLITILGLVAGFGFTALSSVKILWLFLTGEALFFMAMAFGMWFVKIAFIDEAKYYANYIERLDNVMGKRLAIFQESADNAMAKLKEIEEEELKIFDDAPPKIRSDFTFKIILILFILGSISILSSLLQN